MCAEWASTKDLKAMKNLIKAGLSPRPSPTPLPTLSLPAAPTSTTGTGALPVVPVILGVIDASETAVLSPTAAVLTSNATDTVLSVVALEGIQPCTIEPTATTTALDNTTPSLLPPVLTATATVAPSAFEGSSDTSALPPSSIAVTSGDYSDAVLLAPLEHSNDAAAITVAAAAAAVVVAVAVASSTSIL